MRRTSPHLRVESLEQRLCLTVSATVSNGHLIVSGEPDGPVQINAVAANTYQVVDNGAVVATLAGVTRNIRVTVDSSIPRSNDVITLNLNGFTTPLSVRLDAGDGNNTFNITNGTVNRTLIIIGGSGNDTVVIGPAATIGRHFVVHSMSGADAVTVQGTVMGRTVYRAGVGADMFLLDDPGVLVGRVDIYGQSGSDTVTLLGQTTGSVLIELAGGNDSVSSGSFFDATGAITIDGGPGNDSFSFDGTFGAPLTVDAGNGNDVFQMAGQFAGAVDLEGGYGDDSFALDPLAVFEAPVTLVGSRHDDTFQLEGYYFDDVFVDGQAGADSLVFGSEGFFEANLTARGGSGADSFVTSATVQGLFNANGGLGLDAISLLEGTFGAFSPAGFDEVHGGTLALDAQQQEVLAALLTGDQLQPVNDSLLLITGQPVADVTAVRLPDGQVFTVTLEMLTKVLGDDTLGELTSVNEGASVVLNESEVFALADLAAAALLMPLNGATAAALPGSPVDSLGGTELQDLALAQLLFTVERQDLLANVTHGFDLGNFSQSLLTNTVNRMRLGTPGGLL